jgi:hypothetical protein
MCMVLIWRVSPLSNPGRVRSLINFQVGPASQLVVEVTEWEGGYLLNWKKQTLPEGVGDEVLFQRWKGDRTWAEAGRNIDWFPKGTALVYRTQGFRSPDGALMELFASGTASPSKGSTSDPQASVEGARPKKRARPSSPDVEVVSGKGASTQMTLPTS